MKKYHYEFYCSCGNHKSRSALSCRSCQIKRRQLRGWFITPDLIKGKRGCVGRAKPFHLRKALPKHYMEEDYGGSLNWRGIYNKTQYNQMKKELEMRK